MRKKMWVYSFLSGMLVMGLAACSPTGTFPSIPLPGAEGTRLSTVPPVVVTTRPKPPVTLMPNATPTSTAGQPTTATQTGSTSAPSAARAGASPTRALTASAETPTPPPTAGWTTYTSATLQLVLDYPSDWRPAEQADRLTFTSPQGIAIQVGFTETGGLTPEDYVRNNDLPNTRCTSEANDYGLMARICLDTLSRVYTADIPIEWPNGAKELLSLGMFRGGDLQVFQTMVRSVRPAP